MKRVLLIGLLAVLCCVGFVVQVYRASTRTPRLISQMSQKAAQNVQEFMKEIRGW